MGIGRLFYFCVMFTAAAVAAALVHATTDPRVMVLDLTAITLAESALRIVASCARAQNAGKPYWLAFVAGIPIVSAVPSVYLLIAPPKATIRTTNLAGSSQSAALS